MFDGFNGVEIVKQHLEGLTLTYKTIKDAWTMQPVQELSDELDALYMFEDAEEGEVISYEGRHKQRVIKSITFITVCPLTNLRARRKELYEAVHGFQLDPTTTRLNWRRGQVRDGGIMGGIIWYFDTYDYSFKQSSD